MKRLIFLLAGILMSATIAMPANADEPAEATCVSDSGGTVYTWTCANPSRHAVDWNERWVCKVGYQVYSADHYINYHFDGKAWVFVGETVENVKWTTIRPLTSIENQTEACYEYLLVRKCYWHTHRVYFPRAYERRHPHRNVKCKMVTVRREWK